MPTRTELDRSYRTMGDTADLLEQIARDLRRAGKGDRAAEADDAAYNLNRAKRVLDALRKGQ